MNNVQVTATFIAIIVYCCIGWFYGIGPALLSLIIFTLGRIEGREDYREEYRRMNLEQE